ncbi:indole-3-glycerol phosphate synthase TrpC [Cytobacillus purgationiresistens]|uniref:Indole-3-glycerol phosphate synthase n=1 Tax=Cytobacillus purgationiresistens TaxID=863449 RepID=A0ABU0AJY4_9BACI|nr:indole-3-glycerol phosphate synthase TrpC [Cytobacillus purgationiresistens]MDQ0270365.1 indole-3-glycerol phosphate synthase [Cytobacillus purgationiresistens]
MDTILDKIIAEKEKEVAVLSNAAIYEDNLVREKRSLLSRLQKGEELAIIAEFKRASPSKGEINATLDPSEQARMYKAYGADAISVLTDKTFFKGSHEDLTVVYETVDVPILCKDFIIDEKQIIQAKNAGASLILLIVAALERERLQTLFDFAVKNDLEVLVEVHNDAEAALAIGLGAQIIGVNNRDLKTFQVDIGMTEKLAPVIKQAGAFLISESGLKTEEDVARVIRAGADGILVGEAFMKAENLEGLLISMKQPVKGVKR